MIPVVAASETGRAQTICVSSLQALRMWGRGTHRLRLQSQYRVTNQTVSGTVWKSRRNRVIAPYAKTDLTLRGVPKYSGARETLLEFAATMR